MTEKILIVDDDLETLRLVGLMLQRQGYQIVAAQNGTQAIAMARNENPDLVLLDIMMPEIDGFETARQLRKDNDTSSIPILMFTARSQVDDKVAGYEAGADDYLAKPVHPAELVARIKALLTRIRPVAPATPENGHVIGVIAAKGGMGVSTLTLNLAISIYQKTLTEVTAIEMRPGQGTFAADLGFPNPEGLNNLLRKRAEDINLDAVEKELVKSAYGIRMLMASSLSQDVPLMEAVEAHKAILQQLPRLGDFVLLDIGTPYLPIFDEALDVCGEIILLVEPYPITVQRTRTLFDELAEKGLGKTKPVSVVLLNRVRADMQLSISQVQEMLGQPVIQVIPPAPEQAYQAAIKYLPIINIQPEGLISQQFGKLADMITQRIH
jgi:CheY-like chemotaxis protein/MinD-like ATPase involved in chromosome partitioning or flagellar assembly